MEISNGMGMRKTNILIVDAFPIWREGIKSAISANKDIDVAMESVDVAAIRSAVNEGLVNFAIVDLEVPNGEWAGNDTFAQESGFPSSCARHQCSP